MARCEISYYSAVLGKWTMMTVLLPELEKTPSPLPALYLLHGLMDDHSIWCRMTSIERYVREVPLVVVMPDAGRSFCTNARQGPPYEDHLMGEVTGFVERFFPVGATRGSRAIAGLSMGGYGAMKLGLKFPDRFAGIAAHSGVFDGDGFLARHRESNEFQRIFGNKITGGPDDVFALAARLAPEKAPAIYFDCGSSDALLPDSRRLHERLTALGIRHVYRENSGGHDWSYWDAQIVTSLSFLMPHLSPAR